MKYVVKIKETIIGSVLIESDSIEDAISAAKVNAYLEGYDECEEDMTVLSISEMN